MTLPETASGRCHPDWLLALDAFRAALLRAGYSAHTRRDYHQDALRLGVRTGWAPDELDEQRLADAADREASTGLSLGIRRRRISAWRAFLHHLRQSRGAWAHPSMGGREEPLALLRTLLAGAVKLPVADRLALRLALLGGLRAGELARLRVLDWRSTKATLRIVEGARILPLTVALQEDLMALREHIAWARHRPLWPGQQGYAATPRTLHARLARALATLGHAGCRLDRLRRDLATELRERGAPPGLVVTWLGADGGEALAPRRAGFARLDALRRGLQSLEDEALPVREAA